MIAFDAPDFKKIVIVGLGGTGAQVARSVCRTLYDMRRNNLQLKDVVFIDPDRVEAKNVGRQMFTSADRGKYKAEVLAGRFSAALGIEIEAFCEPLDAYRHLQPQYRYSQALIIGAVDNEAARAEIADAGMLWLDCGNDRHSGQVILGNHYKPLSDTFFNMLGGATKVGTLPAASVLFPDLLEPAPEPDPTLSCAELIAIGEQHLLINDHIGIVAAEYVHRLLHRMPIYSFMTYVNIDPVTTVKPMLITSENLRLFTPQKAAV